MATRENNTKRCLGQMLHVECTQWTPMVPVEGASLESVGVRVVKTFLKEKMIKWNNNIINTER